MRGVLLAVVPVMLAAGAVTLYQLAIQPAPPRTVVARDAAVAMRAMTGPTGDAGRCIVSR